MDYILDTHTFIWFINGEELSSNLVAKIKNLDNSCYISIASLWEIAIKTSLGKLTLRSDFGSIKDFLFNNNIEILPVTFDHIQQLIKLPVHHNDPFDRVIIAQGITENITILTKDKNFLYTASISFGNNHFPATHITNSPFAGCVSKYCFTSTTVPRTVSSKTLVSSRETDICLSVPK